MGDIIKPKTKRLNIDLPIDFYNQVKARAAENDMLLKKYVMIALAEKMIKEKCQ